MSEKSRLLRKGARSGVLGSPSDLCIAAPLVDNDYDPAAHTAAGRIGFYYSRAVAAEKMGVVIMGSDILSVYAGGIAAAGYLRPGNTNDTTAGNIRHTGTDFEGRLGSDWVSFTSLGLLATNITLAGGTGNPKLLLVDDTYCWELRDSSNSRSVVGTLGIPTHADISSVNPRFVFKFLVSVTDGGGDGDSDWRLEVRYVADGEGVNTAYAETLDISVPTQNVPRGIHTGVFTLDRTLMVAGDIITVSLTRLGLTDVYGGDLAVLIQAQLEFQS